MKKVFILSVIAIMALFVANNSFGQSSNCQVNLSSYWAVTPNWTSFATVPTSVCVGEQVTFNLTLDGNYAWDIVGNYPTTNGYIQGGSGNTINRTTNMLNIPGTYEFKITLYGSGCDRDTVLNVAVLEAPTNLSLVATGGNQVCASNQVTFTAGATNALPGSSTYTWSVNGNPIVVADPTSNVLEYIPNHGDVVSFAVSNGTCSATLPLLQAISMMVYDAPTPVIAFDDLNIAGNFCDGQTAVINETSGNANIASWEFVVAGVSTTETSATHTWPVTMAQNGLQAHVVVTDNNGCQGTSNTLTIGVNALPDLSVSPLPYSTCNGADMHLRLSGFTGVGPYNLEFWNTGHTTQYPIVSSTPVLPASGTIDVDVDIPYGTPSTHVRIIDTGTGCANW